MILYTKLIIGLQLRILRMDIHSMPEIAFHFKISWYGMTWLFLAYFGSTGKSETLISELKNTEYRFLRSPFLICRKCAVAIRCTYTDSNVKTVARLLSSCSYDMEVCVL